MNYRHIYHAGCFADVFKHIIITYIIDKLKQKDTPFSVLDTHAGIGIYALDSENAVKTNEAQDGIIKFYSEAKNNTLFNDYFNIINSLNEKEILNYPGSPYIIKSLLRPQDNLILSELHKDDFLTLKNNFKYDKQVAVHYNDGYKAIKAFLPFKTNRGLILIDPPYEKESEFDDLTEALNIACKRFNHGIYAIWYPIKSAKTINNWYRELIKLQFTKILAIEHYIYEYDETDRLNGSGMVIINPPWQLDNQVKLALPVLTDILKNDSKPRYKIEYLKE